MQLARKLIDKYKNIGNIDDLNKLSNLIEKCLTFSPKDRPYLEEISKEITSINFGQDEYISMLVNSSNSIDKETQTQVSKDSSKELKSIELSKSPANESKNSQEFFFIINLIDKHLEGKTKEKGEILNVILNQNINHFEYYYTQKTVWNFIQQSISNDQLNILEYLVLKPKLSVSAMILGESIDIGYTKAIYKEENKNLFEDKGAQNFKRLVLMIQKSESLRILKLDTFIQLKDKFKALVKSLEACQKLEELSLNFNRICDDGIDILISSVKLNNIRILNLYSVDFTNESADKLFKVLTEKSKNLHSINVGGNQFELNKDIIESKQMDNFFKFLSVFKLKFFNLSGNSNTIDSYGIKEIIKSLKKQNLEYLNLGDLAFDYESMMDLLASIKEMPKLKYIDASHDPLNEIATNEKLDNLLSALKNNLSILTHIEVVCIRGWSLPMKFLLELCKNLQLKVNSGFQELDISRCSFIPEYNEDQLKDWFFSSGFTFNLNFKN